MSNYFLSINQLAYFSRATDSGKKRIIKEQLSPNPVKVFWYQLPKARMKKCLTSNGDLQPIYDGINILMNKKPIKKRQNDDRLASIEALQRFVQLKLPTVMKSINYTIIKPDSTSLTIADVEIIVAPDLVVKGILNGKTVIGGIKFHISKNKPFDYNQSVYVASIIHQYLKTHIAKEGEFVLPELCFSLDVFGDRIVPAPANTKKILSEVEETCISVKKAWVTI
jgi:hypothetical protein